MFLTDISMSKLDFDCRYKQNTKYLDAYEMWRNVVEKISSHASLCWTLNI